MSSSEVVFAQRSDAFQALKQYNNVQLDGKPMRIEIIGTNSEIPVSAHVNVVGGVNGRRIVVMPAGRGRGSAAVNRQSGQRSRGGLWNGCRPARGWGHGGRGMKKGIDKSADDLDKELDNYHAKSMQT